jgi:hypothetical protein
MVELVISSCRPLNVDPSFVGLTQSVVKRNFENGGVEVVVKFSRCKRLHLLDDVTNREECRTIGCPAKGMTFGSIG